MLGLVHVARDTVGLGRPWRKVGSGAGSPGQGIVEYGLILGGAAAVALIALVFFPDQVAAVIDAIGTAIDRATT